MKVKLLRKIRKRYYIEIVYEPFTGHDSVEQVVAKDLGLPFYKTVDSHDSNGFRTAYKKTEPEAYDELKKMIMCDWKEKFKHSDGRRKLVWYKH